MWTLVSAILFSSLHTIRYGLVIILAGVYIYFGPDGSDDQVYKEIFEANCRGGSSSISIEPGYELYNKLIGKIGLCSLGIDFSLWVFFIISYLTLIYFGSKITPPKDFFYISTILAYYLVTYQLTFNFRGGMASTLAAIAIISISSNWLASICFGLLAISFHIQTLPVLTVFYFFAAKTRYKFIYILFVTLLIYLVYDFLYGFVLIQGLNYLAAFSGSVRLSSAPYIITYGFVLWQARRLRIPNLRPVLLFGLFVNLIFITNSHLAARMSRPVEPLLMVGLFYALEAFKPPLKKELRFLIALIPGIMFFLVEQLQG